MGFDAAKLKPVLKPATAFASCYRERLAKFEVVGYARSFRRGSVHYLRFWFCKALSHCLSQRSQREFLKNAFFGSYLYRFISTRNRGLWFSRLSARPCVARPRCSCRSRSGTAAPCDRPQCHRLDVGVPVSAMTSCKNLRPQAGSKVGDVALDVEPGRAYGGVPVA